MIRYISFILNWMVLLQPAGLRWLLPRDRGIGAVRADDFPPEVGGRKNSLHLGVLGPEPQNDSLGGTDPPPWDLNIRGGKKFGSIPGRFEQGILAFCWRFMFFFLMEPIGKFSWKKILFEDQFHSHTCWWIQNVDILNISWFPAKICHVLEDLCIMLYPHLIHIPPAKVIPSHAGRIL